jgi:hypothetical protein
MITDTMLLSPLATPFEPSLSTSCNGAPYFHIYNNGVPSMVHVSGEFEIIHGVSDEAIEQLFPPTLEELQEMDEVDVFVEMLAEMAILEDRDESARSFADIKKRWASRRKEGVPVRGTAGGSGSSGHRSRAHFHNTNPVAGVPMVQHHRLSTDIVPYNANQARLTHFHGDSQYASKLKTKNMNSKVNNNRWAFRGNMKPIMQPKQGY